MNVAELIDLLGQHPPGLAVLVFDERTGFPEPLATATLEPGSPSHGLQAVLILESREPAMAPATAPISPQPATVQARES